MNDKIIPIEKLIGDSVIQKFGYNIVQQTKNRSITVQNFQPHSNKQRIPYLKQQIQKLQASLYTNKIEKDFFPDYSKLIQKKIKQYNYIVSYKHLKDKHINNEMEQILGHVEKTKEEKLFQKINSIKQQLMKKQNLKDNLKQYNLNNQLNSLYKQYQDLYSKPNNKIQSSNKIALSRSYASSNKHIINKQSTVISNFTTSRHNSFITQNQNNNSMLGIARISKVTYEYKLQKPKGLKNLDPFQKQQKNNYIESKKVENKIKNQKQILDLWKIRIQQIKEDEKKKSKIINLSSNQNFSSDKKLILKKSFGQQNHINQIKLMQHSKNQQLKSNKSNFDQYQQKKNIFTNIIRRRNNRFVKPKGTKLLVEFNSHEAAQNLLIGKKRVLKNQDDKKNNFIQKQDYSSVHILQGAPIKVRQEIDYSVQYKNQKINASLRRKRRY